MNERQIKALNTLYAATIEVMEAFAPENVGASERREALSRMIENFLISASSPNEGIVFSEIPRNSMGTIPNDSKSQYASQEGASSKAEETVGGNTLHSKKREDCNFRYAVSPVNLDGGYIFKRVKQKDDRDPGTLYPYELYIEDDKGSFKIDALLDKYGEEEYKKTFPEMVVELVPGDISHSDATCLKTVEEGDVIKDGKSWKVTKRVKVTYGK